jgi:hypothetical protein
MAQQAKAERNDLLRVIERQIKRRTKGEITRGRKA